MCGLDLPSLAGNRQLLVAAQDQPDLHPWPCNRAVHRYPELAYLDPGKQPNSKEVQVQACEQLLKMKEMVYEVQTVKFVF